MLAGDFIKVSQKRAIFRSDGLMGEKDVGKRVFVLVAESFEIEGRKRVEVPVLRGDWPSQ